MVQDVNTRPVLKPLAMHRAELTAFAYCIPLLNMKDFSIHQVTDLNAKLSSRVRAHARTRARAHTHNYAHADTLSLSYTHTQTHNVQLSTPFSNHAFPLSMIGTRLTGHKKAVIALSITPWPIPPPHPYRHNVYSFHPARYTDLTLQIYINTHLSVISVSFCWKHPTGSG